MEKLNQFFAQHGSKVIAVLLILVYLKSCGVSSDVSTLRKEVKAQQVKIDSLPSVKALQIEGLKAEKRMIQATDRRMLDVQRQTEIDNEIQKLSK